MEPQTQWMLSVLEITGLEADTEVVVWDNWPEEEDKEEDKGQTAGIVEHVGEEAATVALCWS